MTSRASSRETRLLAPPRPGRLGSWSYALRTTNPPPGADPRSLDPVTRWLVVTRAAVLPMTLIAALVGRAAGRARRRLLLAAAAAWRWSACSPRTPATTCSTTCRHRRGLDTAGYPRAQYAPHPILSGMVRRRSVGLAVLG
jgi:1,4-dihydroxy-2-naphthoate octaprenyltransferase